MRAANVLSTLAAITVIASPVLAQRDNNPPANNPPANNSPANSQTNSPANSPTNSPGRSPSNTQTNAPPTSNRAAPSPSSDSAFPTPSPKAPPTTSDSSPSPSSTSASPSSNSPSSSGSESTDVGLTGLPTLTRNFAIPTYPAPTPPPTNNAPFMQQSSAPDGTVFIAVGAILGAFGVAVLLWRLIVSLLLHRSVRRAALAQHDATSKAGFPAPPAPFYKYSDQASPVGTPGARGIRRTNRNTIVPSGTPSQSNLFFSPTAAGSTTGPGARGSTFLPSGFYAAGSSTPGGHGPSISLTNLRPDSVVQPNGSRNSLMNPSPPDSPHFSARRDTSSSSVNLNPRQPGQRAPSAYLEDLLADDPGSLPPPHMPPNSGHRGNGSSRNRF